MLAFKWQNGWIDIVQLWLKAFSLFGVLWWTRLLFFSNASGGVMLHVSDWLIMDIEHSCSIP